MTLDQQLAIARQMLADLVALRGEQDQTVRTGVIAILHGREKVDGMTPTNRFLEAEISRMEETIKNCALGSEG